LHQQHQPGGVLLGRLLNRRAEILRDARVELARQRNRRRAVVHREGCGESHDVLHYCKPIR
jgi:hypothetical protein